MVSVYKDVAEGNDLLMLSDLLHVLIVQLSQLEQRFTDDLKFPFNGTTKYAIANVSIDYFAFNHLAKKPT